jgi:hypothetical protein
VHTFWNQYTLFADKFQVNVCYKAVFIHSDVKLSVINAAWQELNQKTPPQRRFEADIRSR